MEREEEGRLIMILANSSPIKILGHITVFGKKMTGKERGRAEESKKRGISKDVTKRKMKCVEWPTTDTHGLLQQS